MTGRDLILYILENRLEDEPVFDDGKFIGFMTAAEAAVKMNVGVPTIYVWVGLGYLTGFVIGDTMYIPADAKSPMENVGKE